MRQTLIRLRYATLGRRDLGAVEGISERLLVPVLEALLSQFPFVADGFHSDNGSEHVNHRVAALPGRLHVGKFTKSRARRFAGIVNAFAQRELSPFLNFHRPCLFATERLGAAGNAGAAAESSRCAAPPLRSGPSGDMAAAPA